MSAETIETVVDLMNLLERELGEPVEDLGVAVRMLLEQARQSERSLQAMARDREPMPAERFAEMIRVQVGLAAQIGIAPPADHDLAWLAAHEARVKR